jgi:hypothetical protein
MDAANCRFFLEKTARAISGQLINVCHLSLSESFAAIKLAQTAHHNAAEIVYRRNINNPYARTSVARGTRSNSCARQRAPKMDSRTDAIFRPGIAKMRNGSE